MQEYTVEKDKTGFDLVRDKLKWIDIVNVEPGLCRANPNDISGDRTIAWYDAYVLKPMIAAGEISDGSNSPFDDRKMRYDGARVNLSPTGRDNYLHLSLGHSHFLEYREKKDRTPKETQRLADLGNEHFEDPYAFFPRNPGVTGIIRTNDRKIVVGQRDVEPDRYDGLLQGAAGHLAYREDPRKVRLEEDMFRELKEETGIPEGSVKGLEVLGLFSDPSVAGDDLDFTYLIEAEVPSKYFTEGLWKEEVPEKNREHSQFFAISDYDSLQTLVNEGRLEGREFDIVFSTRGPLATLTPEDFK